MRSLAILALLAAVAVAQEERKAGERAFLGVTVANVSDETRARFKSLPKDVGAGAVLVEIVDGSPAAAAGFRAGDIVLSFGGKAIANQDDLIDVVGASRVGDVVTYKLRRGTGSIEGKVKLARRELPRAIEIMPPIGDERPAPERPNLKRRLDRLDTDIAELRKRILKARETAAPKAHPRSLGGWIHREEKRAEAARKRGDMEGLRYHAVRLTVLKEMREAGAKLPARKLDRIEKKLDEILARLDRMK